MSALSFITLSNSPSQDTHSKNHQDVFHFIESEMLEGASSPTPCPMQEIHNCFSPAPQVTPAPYSEDDLSWFKLTESTLLSLLDQHVYAVKKVPITISHGRYCFQSWILVCKIQMRAMERAGWPLERTDSQSTHRGFVTYFCVPTQRLGNTALEDEVFLTQNEFVFLLRLC